MDSRPTAMDAGTGTGGLGRSQESRSFDPHVAENDVVKQSVRVPMDTARFLSNELLASVQTDKTCTIECDTNASNSVINLSGNAESVQIALKKTSELATQLRMKNHLLDKTGMQKLFGSDKGAHFCDSLQLRQKGGLVKVILGSEIEPVIKNVVPSREKPVRMVAGFDSNAACDDGSPFKIGPLSVLVEKGDITKETTDAIVNSTDETLVLSTGAVQKAIAAACGPEVLQECKTLGRTVDGIAVTSAGQLPSKFIFHLAPGSGPRRWQKVVRKALDEAEKRKLKSIAFPALGTGSAQINASEMAEDILEGLEDFIQKTTPSSIKTVKFSIFQADMLDKFIAATNKVAQPKKSHNTDGNTGSASGGCFKIGSLSLIIYKGDITKETTDVIANSTDETLELSTGAVQKAMVAAGGAQIAQECQQLGHTVDGIAVTGAGQMTSKFIFHLAPGTGPMRWQNLVEKALEEAEKRQLHSIAFPAFGTGSAEISANEIAEAMVEGLTRFALHANPSFLTTIKFCIFQADMLDNFTSAASRISLREQACRKDGSAGQSYGGPSKWSIGALSLIIQQGDITKETTDAIANSTNENLDLSTGAVQKAIAAAGGAKVVEECQKLGHTTDGIAVTGAGQMACKFIFHLAPKPGQLRWHKVVKKALDEADKRKLQSIAFPALGTGSAQVSANEVAEAMVEGLIYFSQHANPSSLRTVKFCIFQADMLQKFIAATNKIFQREQEGEKALSAKSEKGGFFKVGPLSLIIEEGDITMETTDAIANSTDEAIGLSTGAVQKAIAVAGGSEVVQECKMLGCTVDGMAVTQAGQMASKFIFHLAPKPGLLRWQKAVKKALDEAERRNLHSIAFPAMGTGSAQISANEMAEAMVEGVIYFVQHANPSSLKTVKFCIFQTDMLDKFIMATNTICQRKRASEREVNLRILAMSDATLDDLVGKIDSFSRENLRTTVLDDKRDKSAIKNMTSNQKRELELFAKSTDVELQIRSSSITVTGDPADVINVKDYITKMLTKIGDKEHTVKQLSKEVSWEYKDANGLFQAYSPHENYNIEEAYGRKKSCVRWATKTTFKIVTFNNMKGHLIDNPAKSVTVRRTQKAKPKGAFQQQPPSHWSPMNTTEHVKLIDLTKGTPEYTEIATAFGRTMSSTDIVKVERVQTLSLYNGYITQKAAVERKNPQGKQNEQFLWHGTDEKSVKNIISNGFNRSYCGQHATAYGKGVYFAAEASYSAQPTYSPADAQGHKRMFYAHVLTGEYTKGRSDLKEAPLKNNNDHTRYDSVVNDMTNPTVFVVFIDTAAYPSHLVTYK